MTISRGKRSDRPPEHEHMTAVLARAAYEVALRETTPRSWIELELSLWKSIGERLESWNARNAVKVNRKSRVLRGNRKRHRAK